MSSLTVQFQFEIGEMVYLKSATHNLSNVPKQFVVTSRIVEETSGGVDKTYELVSWDEPVPEVALTREVPKYQKRCSEFHQDKEELIVNELAASKIAELRMGRSVRGE